MTRSRNCRAGLKGVTEARGKEDERRSLIRKAMLEKPYQCSVRVTCVCELFTPTYISKTLRGR